MTDMTVANTIAKQIGGMAFAMMGAKNKLGDEKSLSFKIGRNAKKVQYVKVTLDPSDTYTVEFSRVTPHRLNKKTWVHSGGEKKVISEVEGVYVDMLRSVIESNTGLYLSM